MNDNKIIDMKTAKPLDNQTLGGNHDKLKSSSNGGEPPMKNDYVTKDELEKAIDSTNNKIDLLEAHLDTKFEKQKVWFYSTGIAIVVAVPAIIKFFM